jgi:hypothetical protein
MRDMDLGDNSLWEIWLPLRADIRMTEGPRDQPLALHRRFVRRYQAGDGAWVYHEVAE